MHGDRIKGVVTQGDTPYNGLYSTPGGGCKAGFHCTPECLLSCGELILGWRRAVLNIKNRCF